MVASFITIYLLQSIVVYYRDDGNEPSELAVEREMDAGSALLHFIDRADQREAEADVEVGVGTEATLEAEACAGEAAVAEGAAAPDAAASRKR